MLITIWFSISEIKYFDQVPSHSIHNTPLPAIIAEILIENRWELLRHKTKIWTLNGIRLNMDVRLYPPNRSLSGKKRLDRDFLNAQWPNFGNWAFKKCQITVWSFFSTQRAISGVEPNTDTTQKLDEKEFGEPL